MHLNRPENQPLNIKARIDNMISFGFGLYRKLLHSPLFGWGRIYSYQTKLSLTFLHINRKYIWQFVCHRCFHFDQHFWAYHNYNRNFSTFPNKYRKIRFLSDFNEWLNEIGYKLNFGYKSNCTISSKNCSYGKYM